MKKNAATTTPNMAKEQRKELRTIKSEIRKLARSYNALDRQTDREIAKLMRLTTRQQSGLNKKATALEKRRNILAGRLS